MHILEHAAPGVADKLRSLPPERRRDILGRACRLVSETIRGLEPEVCGLLQAVSGGGALSEAQVALAQKLAEEADAHYFSLNDGDGDDVEAPARTEAHNWFLKARLLTAIATGFGASSWSHTADAVYELCSARDDPSDIIALIEFEAKTRQG